MADSLFLTGLRRTVSKRALARALRAGILSGALMAGQTIGAHAYTFDTGPDWSVKWDNTIKYSFAARTSGQNSELLASQNADDADRNFGPWDTVLDRLELISGLDVKYQNYLFRVSGEGLYDPTYASASNANRNAATFNGNGPSDRFPDKTQLLDGRDFQLYDAFVGGTTDISDHRFAWRIGRYAQEWGETLFFAGNGIAGGMAPYDISKLTEDPTAQAKEYVLPVAQAGGTLSISDGLTVSGFYQFEWRPDTLPAVGSYLNTADLLPNGGESILITPRNFTNVYYSRDADVNAKNLGQYGLSLKWTTPDSNYDFGLYFVNHHAREPEFVTRGSVVLGPVCPPACLFPVGITPPGTYSVVYGQNIQDYGASVSTNIFDQNFALEVSDRDNTPLVSNSSLASGAPISNGADAPYAIGNTLHYNVSQNTILDRTRFWDGGNLLWEAGGEHLLGVNHGAQYFNRDAGHTDAYGFRAVFLPQYYQVVPNIDLTLVTGLGYNLNGHAADTSAFGAGDSYHGGDATIGARLDIGANLQTQLSYVRYIGTAADTASADRDFMSLTLTGSF